jgi:hypothetical protein
MSSNLRVDRILPSTGTEVGVGTATGSVALYGDVNIAGTLTYEDVTNIDSVGLVTARSGLHVTGGDVGIGVTNPTSFGPTLQVAGTDPALLLQDTATAVDYFGANVTSGITQLWYDDAAALTINTATGLSGSGLAERLRITSAGRLGVGLASPNSNLHVKGGSDSTDNLLLTLQSNGVASDGSLSTGLRLINSTADTSIHGADIRAIRTGSATADLSFSLYNGGSSPTERLRITSAGNIGIGEGTPLGKLHIKTGDSGASSVQAEADELVIEGSGSSGVTILSSTTGEGLLNFGDSSDINVGSIVYRHSTNSMQVKTADVERLSIKSNGDFQIAWTDGQFVGQYYDANYYMGLTFASNNRELYIDNKSNDTRADILLRTVQGPGTPVERLRVASDGNVTLGYSGNSLYFQNGFNNSKSRIQNGGGSNNSNLRFYTISSGTEAERLRIQSDGNVIPLSNGAHNLGLSGNRWNKVWTNYVRHGTRSATYEKTFTATSDGSGNLTFDCGILWLIDDSSFEVFCHMDRTGSHNNFAARYKFYGSKVSGYGTQGTYNVDTTHRYIISPVSNPTVTHYTPSGQGSAHGTRVSHTGTVANAQYRLTMLIHWVGIQEVT